MTNHDIGYATHWLYKASDSLDTANSAQSDAQMGIAYALKALLLEMGETPYPKAEEILQEAGVCEVNSLAQAKTQIAIGHLILDLVKVQERKTMLAAMCDDD